MKNLIYIITVLALFTIRDLRSQNILFMDKSKDYDKKVEEVFLETGAKLFQKKIEKLEKESESLSQQLEKLNSELAILNSNMTCIISEFPQSAVSKEDSVKYCECISKRAKLERRKEDLNREIKIADSIKGVRQSEIVCLNNLKNNQPKLLNKHSITDSITSILSSLRESNFDNPILTKYNIAEKLKNYFRLIETNNSCVSDNKNIFKSLADSLLAFEKKEFDSQLKGNLGIKSTFNLRNGTEQVLQPTLKAGGTYRIYKRFLAEVEINSNLLDLGDGVYNSSANLLIREASKLSFSAGADYLIKNVLGFSGGFSFALKKLSDSTRVESDSTDLISSVDNVGTINFNAGFEILILSQKLSVFYGINYTNVVTNIESFNQFYSNVENPQTNYFIHEVGIRAVLADNIYAELNVKFTNNKIRDILGNDDFIIPVLRLSTNLFGI